MNACRDGEAVWDIDGEGKRVKDLYERTRPWDPSIGEWRRQRAQVGAARG